MIISNAVCTRWVGHDFGNWLGKIDRPLCPLIIGAVAWAITGSWIIALINAIGFVVWRYPGWGEQFLAMHGDKHHFDNRNKSLPPTWLADKIYKPKNQTQRKMYGVIWGGLRGLYDIFAFITLAIVLQNYYIALIGLLMAAQGGIYFLVGKYIKQDTAPAEWILGGYRGVLWLRAITL